MMNDYFDWQANKQCPPIERRPTLDDVAAYNAAMAEDFERRRKADLEATQPLPLLDLALEVGE